MTFIKQLLCIVFLLFVTNLDAKLSRRAYIDSLKQSLNQTSDQQQLAKISIDLAKNYRQLSKDTALLYADASIGYANGLKDKYDLTYGLMVKGLILRKKGDLDASVEFLNKALNEAKLDQNEILIAKIYNNLGLTYKQQNKKIEARFAYQLALELKQKLNQRKDLPTTYDNIAFLNLEIGKSEEALDGFLKALDIRREIGDSLQIVKSYVNLGHFYKERLDVDESLKYYQDALRINKKLGRYNALITVYKAIAATYRVKGSVDKNRSNLLQSLKMNKLALKYAYQTKDKVEVSSALVRIGETYTHLDSFAKAQEYLDQGMELSKDGGKLYTVYEGLISLSRNYRAKGDAVKAVLYAAKALDYGIKRNDLGDIRNAYLALSNAYYDERNFKKAYDFQKKYTALNDSLNNIENATRVAEKRALFDFEQQEKDILNLEKENDLIEEQAALERYLLLLFLLAIAVVVLIMYRSAIARKRGYEIVKRQKAEVEKQRDKVKEKSEELQLSYHTIENLSLIGKEVISNLNIEDINASVYKHLKELMDLDVFGIDIYDPEKNKLVTKGMLENGNVLADHETVISDEGLAGICFLKSEEIHINHYDKEYHNYIKERRIVKGDKMESVVYIPLVHHGECIGVLTVQHSEPNAFNGNHLNIIRNIANYSAIAIDNSKKYDMLNAQKDQIAAQSHEVQESIRYAQNIQQSLLPSASFMKDMLKEHFIMYQPCHIVSGDFYWAHQLEDGRKLIIAADCTGHGVPGAMLSMIAISQLNEIVFNNKVTDPGTILDELRLMIISSMKTQEKQRDDSLDATVICLDEANKKIKVSGAFNRMMHMTSAEDIVEYDCNRQPVGNYPIMEPFETRTVEYNENDVIYIMSDGYYDQIGGERMKKFGAKRMKNTLLKMYDMPMEGQHQQLTDIMQEWEKDMFQLDDRCIIGIRL